MPSQPKNKPGRSVPVRILRGFAIFLLSVVLLVLIVLLLIQTSPVQDFARGKIVTFLEKKLETKVAIQRLDIDFPKMLVLEGVYIEDRTRDTLLAGRKLKVDLDMFKLLNNEVKIQEINLEGITMKIKRQMPDTIFNYQFIVDAFTPKSTATPADTAAMKMAIDKIIIDDTRLVFFDVVTGNDVDLYFGHFDTKIDRFDPAQLTYDIPNINLSKVRGHIRQTAPLELTVVNTNPAPAMSNEKPKFLKLTNGQTLLRDIDVSYSNGVSAIDTRFKFSELNILPETIDLEKYVVALKQVELNGLDGTVVMNAPPQAEVVKLTTQSDKEVEVSYLPWKITVGSVRLNDNKFSFNDQTKPRMARGMDYAHLGIDDLTLHADNLLFHNDTIAANIVRGEMRESSGFVLNQLNTDFSYTSKGASLHNLLVQTPGTEIKRSAAIRYPSVAALQQNMNLAEISLDIENSKVQVKDILTFAPDLAAQPAFRHPNATLYLDTKVNGTLGRLNIQELRFRGFGNTSVDVSGMLVNATDPANIAADLNIRNLTTTRSDILSWVPPSTIPDNITLPQQLTLSGTVRGGG